MHFAANSRPAAIVPHIMELPDYIQSVSFRLAHPDVPGSKAFRLATGLLQRMGVPLNALGTPPCQARDGHDAAAAAPRHAVPVRPVTSPSERSSTGPFRRDLAPGEVFLALGVSDGFPLLAAISGNPDKPCMGVDLSAGSEIRPSERPQFLRHFKSIRTADHQLHRLSLRDYFAQLHELPIGCCLIGASAADDPLERLNKAEPHLAENSVVLVENVNDASHRSAASRSSARAQSVPHPARSADAPSWRADAGQRAPGFQLLGRNAAAKRPLQKPIAPVLVPAA